MKKILFLFSILFAVLCYSAPPPDLLPDPVTINSGFVVQDVQNVSNYTFEVQEVAFNYLGNYELGNCYSEYFEQLEEVYLPKEMVIDISCLNLNEINKPPSFYTDNLNGYSFKENMQNSNYGYPLTGDRQLTGFVGNQIRYIN